MSKDIGKFDEPTNAEMVASAHRIQALIDRQFPEVGSKPADFRKPKYGTPEYRQAHACGWIQEEEAVRDREAFQSRRARAIASYGNSSGDPLANRPAPPESRQYAGPTATKAFRDPRLTGNAKAALAVIRAFCGKGRLCDTTKSVLAGQMFKSPRTILRYLSALIDKGYIRTATRRNGRGMDIGLRIWIVASQVLPFFAEDGPLAEWLAKTANSPVKLGRTDMTPINDSSKFSFLSSLITVQNPDNAVP